MSLLVTTLAVGPLQSNCHLVVNEELAEAVVVDPGDEAGRILGHLEEHGARLVGIWLTHAHIDHVGALAAVKRATGAPITVHAAEKEWCVSGRLNLAEAIGLPYEPATPDFSWMTGDGVRALGREWRVVHVPGHSPGGVAVICDEERIAFTGDLIFRGSMGRVDLPGGDMFEMADSLQRFLREDPALRCYVGHGPDTTIAVERADNYLIADFLSNL